VIAYILRFKYNSRPNCLQKGDGSLTVQELQNALHVCLKISQSIEYAAEIGDLKTNSSVNNKSKLKPLCPFLCQNGLLRVGGRLQASKLPFDHMHQIILHPKHHLTKLIIEAEHKKLLHSGCQLTHASLRERYWIVNGKNTIKAVINGCLVCHKLKADTANQLMGKLPHFRVQPARPFLNTGIDFAGPFIIKSGSRRTKTKIKCYVSIFVCLTTRAIHLEAVSELTTQAFIAALKRFISRRGKCAHVYSDNATNFVGAAKELRELGSHFKRAHQSDQVKDYVAQHGIQWHFIPARAPHFGGIWEAGVKSFKHHLRRVMGMAVLTFEELVTLITQIEACLNSRPLVPLSNDPNDPLPLTPGHFLIGSSLTSLPEPDLSSTRVGLLSRWQQLQHRMQQFWRVWSNDYLTHLQQRAKWSSTKANLEPGMVVILKEDNTPPMTWKLAVISEVHPGSDGLVRVVTVRNSQGTFKRPISKLCLLPVNNS
jgi:transposase InsO family protein